MLSHREPCGLRTAVYESNTPKNRPFLGAVKHSASNRGIAGESPAAGSNF